MSEPCPECGGRAVLFGSSFPRHVLRGLWGSRRRYCPDCKARWSGEPGHFPNRLRLAVLLGAACLAGALLWTLRTGGSPSPAVLVDDPEEPGTARRPPPWTTWRQEPSETFQLPPASSPPAGPGTPRSLQRFDPAHPQPRPPSGSAAPGYPAPGPRRARRAARAETSFSFFGSGGFFEKFNAMFRGPKDEAQERQADQILKTDKRQLWDQYGQHFSSKEQAKSAYDELKRRRGAGGRAP